MSQPARVREAARYRFEIDKMEEASRSAIQAAEQCDVHRAIGDALYVAEKFADVCYEVEDPDVRALWPKDVLEEVLSEATDIYERTYEQVTKLLSRCTCRK